MPSVSLPAPAFVNGQASIPPPSVESFDAEFGGVLPAGNTIHSALGQTRYYMFRPTSSSSEMVSRNVILVHGTGTPAIKMVPLAQHLTNTGVTVLIYDTWGHGLSSTPVAPHTPSLFHFQLFHLLNHVGWLKAHILGYSSGGVIVASFAAWFPEAVESLTLVGPAGLTRMENRSWWARLMINGGWGLEWLGQRWILSFISGGPLVFENDWKQKWKDGKLDGPPMPAVEDWENRVHKGHLATVVNSFRHLSVSEIQEDYRKIVKNKVKALMILGEKDPFFLPAPVKKELEGVGWTGTTEVIAAADHGLVKDEAGKIAQLMEQFWKTEDL